MAADFVSLIRQQSIIRRATNGQLAIASLSQGETDHYMIDGERLAFPHYRSSRFGTKLFLHDSLFRAMQPESYVRNHPHRPLLADTFRRMKSLAEERGFEVAVVIVPSDARLYKNYFDDMPPISKAPHFINYVKELSQRSGFKYVDLSELLAPYAEHELLYFRDDTHLNERGHDVVAEILAGHIKSGEIGAPVNHVVKD
jgi:hypothetical protein